jgi:hypothetical protein
MSSFVTGLGWACIAGGAVLCVPALVTAARGQSSRPHGRHGRDQAKADRGAGELWPDVLACLTVAAIGLSLLGDQWKGHTARVLASIPVFAVVGWNVVSWLVSRARRRTA